MFEEIPILLLGALVGGIVGWVAGHQMGTSGCLAGDEGAEAPSDESRKAQEEQIQLEAVARKIRALTLSVAADVSAHQSKVAGITSELQDAEPTQHSQSIVSAVAELVAANQAMQNRLSESQKQIREQTQQLQTTQQLANTDALTGLANRRVLDARLAEITEAPSTAAHAVFALIDIDHFKSFNDTFGHSTGDEVLISVATLIEARLGGQATCARYGGEEFAVVSDAATWREIAEALDAARVELSQTRPIPEAPERQITFSSGVAERMKGEPSDRWMERADRALYTAKRQGRNSVYYCEGEIVKRFSTEQPVEKGVVPSIPPTKRQTSVDQLRELAAHIDHKCVSLAAVAVRIPENRLAEEQRASLLDKTRAHLRGVDRVDFEDARTLLAMMVTSSAQQTAERANQLLNLVNTALEQMSDSPGDHPLASLGVAVLDQTITPDAVIHQAIENADRQALTAATVRRIREPGPNGPAARTDGSTLATAQP